MKRSGGSTRPFRSPTHKANGSDVTPHRHGHKRLKRIKRLECQQQATVNTELPQHSPNLFTRNPVVYFLEVDKICVDVFGILSQFLENLRESVYLVCSVAAGTKIALRIIQVWFWYYAASFLKYLTYTFPRRPWR